MSENVAERELQRSFASLCLEPKPTGASQINQWHPPVPYGEREDGSGRMDPHG